MGGAVFYLMEPVDGFNPHGRLPALHAGDAGVRHAMGLAAVDALAALGAVDHVAVGLGDVGKPDGFLERQVPRWLGELESYADATTAIPGPTSPASTTSAAWLDANRPASWTPGIIHGDYHLANVMFRLRRARASPRSSTGRCARSATRCSTSAGCSPPGRTPGAAAVAGGARRAGGLPDGRRARRPLRRALDARPLGDRPGTRCWPASSSASSSRAPTPAPSPARHPRRSATCCTRRRWGCFSRR